MNIINGRDTQATVHWELGRQIIQIIQQLGGEVANNKKILPPKFSQRQEILPFCDIKCGNSSVFHKGHV